MVEVGVDITDAEAAGPGMGGNHRVTALLPRHTLAELFTVLNLINNHQLPYHISRITN